MMSATLKIFDGSLIVWLMMVFALPLLAGPTDAPSTGASCDAATAVQGNTGNWTLVQGEDSEAVTSLRQMRRN